jgi:hypothetical protein
MTDVDVPFDTSGLIEPATGVHSFGGGSAASIVSPSCHWRNAAVSAMRRPAVLVLDPIVATATFASGRKYPLEL